MKRRRIIQLGIIVFIALNFILVFIDNDARVDRVSYVNSWSNSFTADLKRELYKPVVLSAAFEEPIYFDNDEGVFQEFLVSKGDEVSQGTALFTYRVMDYYKTESGLRQQMDRVRSEVEAIEQAISQMESYRIPDTGLDPASSVLITEEDIFVEVPDSSVEAELMKEQYLAEKEKELNAKQAELTMLENQLTELQQTGDTITVESPYEGKVKHVSTELSDPLIIVESEELHAVGSLTEDERIEVEEGMPAVLQLEELDVLLEGTVESLADNPERLAVEGESNYSFAAGFNEETEEVEEAEEFGATENTDTVEEIEEAEEEPELLPGYHGNLAITIEESPNALAIFEDALHHNIVWQMAPDGTLKRQDVETGLYENHRVEILSGLETDSFLAEEPTSQLREGASFITPLKWKQLNRQSVALRESDWQMPFISGLLSR